MTPKVKVCGVTDAAFAAAAAQRGVDYLGVIFAGKSPRCVTQAAAQRAKVLFRGKAAGR